MSKLDVSLTFGDTYVSKSFDVADLEMDEIMSLVEEMLEFIDLDEPIDDEGNF